MTRKTDVVVVAAGRGSRMKLGFNKALALLDGISILTRTLTRFEANPLVRHIVLVMGSKDKILFEESMRGSKPLFKLKSIVEGGETRADSVKNGLRALDPLQGPNWVMTHDGARPFVSDDLIKRLLEVAFEQGIVVPGTRPVETLRESIQEKTRIVDRDHIYAIQTPQLFHADLIKEVFFDRPTSEKVPTDEAACFELANKPVKIIEGDRHNLKITTPEDMAFAATILQMRPEFQLDSTGLLP